MKAWLARHLRRWADKLDGVVSTSGHIVTFEHAGQPVHVEYFTSETIIENPTPLPKWVHEDSRTHRPTND